MTPGSAPADAPWISIAAHAQLCGGHIWVEERCFELLGAWSVSFPEPNVRVDLAARARHHAWRASLWRDLLPAIGDADPTAVIGPPDADLTALFLELAAAGPSPGAVVRLDSVVLSPLGVAYEQHARRCTPATDGATARTLAIVRADLAADRGPEVR